MMCDKIKVDRVLSTVHHITVLFYRTSKSMWTSGHLPMTAAAYRFPLFPGNDTVPVSFSKRRISAD